MNQNRFSGRAAVVTGGASGIGLATARRLLAEGASVMIGDYNETTGTSAANSLRAEGYQAVLFQQTDVSREANVERLMKGTQEAFGRLDIVFNNAGIGGAIGPITETEADHWDQTFAVLTRGVFLGVKHAARVMIEAGRGGSIINTASIAGLAGGVPPTAYSAAKAAVVSLTQNTANELAEYRIRVNSVCPGIVFTKLMHGGREAEAEAVARQIQPWPDRGEPENIADAVAFLASDESVFVTGHALVVDGGYLSNGLLRTNPLPGGKVKPDYSGITYGLTGRPRDVKRLG
jgi:NAD(P)-dependent dehydrogenase (short-subunit alcohol dehydrogenase family)